MNGLVRYLVKDKPVYLLQLGGVFTEKSSVERPVQRYNLLIRQGPSKMIRYQCFLLNGFKC